MRKLLSCCNLALSHRNMLDKFEILIAPVDLHKFTRLNIKSTLLNLLWFSDAIWSGSTLVQVRACGLMEPSYFLSQFWLITSKVHWNSCETISPATPQLPDSKTSLKITYFIPHSNLSVAFEEVYRNDTYIGILLPMSKFGDITKYLFMVHTPELVLMLMTNRCQANMSSENSLE